MSVITIATPTTTVSIAAVDGSCRQPETGNDDPRPRRAAPAPIAIRCSTAARHRSAASEPTSAREPHRASFVTTARTRDAEQARAARRGSGRTRRPAPGCAPMRPKKNGVKNAVTGAMTSVTTVRWRPARRSPTPCRPRTAADDRRKRPSPATPEGVRPASTISAVGKSGISANCRDRLSERADPRRENPSCAPTTHDDARTGWPGPSQQDDAVDREAVLAPRIASTAIAKDHDRRVTVVDDGWRPRMTSGVSRAVAPRLEQDVGGDRPTARCWSAPHRRTSPRRGKSDRAWHHRESADERRGRRPGSDRQCHDADPEQL